MDQNWKDYALFGTLGGILRILVDFKNRSLLQFGTALVVGVGVAMIVGTLLSGMGWNRQLVLAVAALSAIVADSIIVGIMHIGKEFQEGPWGVLQRLWTKREE